MAKIEGNKVSGVNVKVTDTTTGAIPEGTQVGTLKYVGTDKHSKKVLSGKFASNVQPRNFGKNKRSDEDWECPECGKGPFRAYWAACDACGTRRPS